MNATLTPPSRPGKTQLILEEQITSQVSQLDHDGHPWTIRAALDAGLTSDHFQDDRHGELFRALCLQLDSQGTLDPETAILQLYDAGKISDGDSGTLFDLSRRDASTLTIRENVSKLRTAAAKRKAEHHTRRAGLYLDEGDTIRAAAEMDLAQDALAEVGTAQGSLEKFNPYRFDPESQPPANVPTLYLDGIPVCNRGNISSLVSHKKMGKSRAARAILRAICSGGEHLGFTAPAGRVAYLDFEQSRADFHHLMQGVEEKEEGRLLAYSMAGATIAEGRALVDLLARQDDLRAIVLDGWADLVADVNDPEESNELVRWAMSLAAKHDISILGLLHLNPGSDSKSRGHLGSQLERKCETQLEIQASGEERVICAPVARHRPISKDHGVRIAWSDEASDFVRIAGTLADAKRDERAEERQRLLQDVIAATEMQAWRHADLKQAIMDAEGCKERTARSRISDMLDAAILRHNGNTGIYTATAATATA